MPINTLISGIILRSKDKDKTADFYSKLGLTTHPHQHGGPIHYEVNKSSDDFLVEIYQESEKFSRDALIITVTNINDTLDTVRDFGIKPQTELKETELIKFIYIKDPDDRDLMLVEDISR